MISCLPGSMPEWTRVRIYFRVTFDSTFYTLNDAVSVLLRCTVFTLTDTGRPWRREQPETRGLFFNKCRLRLVLLQSFTFTPNHKNYCTNRAFWRYGSVFHSWSRRDPWTGYFSVLKSDLIQLIN